MFYASWNFPVGDSRHLRWVYPQLPPAHQMSQVLHLTLAELTLGHLGLELVGSQPLQHRTQVLLVFCLAATIY